MTQIRLGTPGDAARERELWQLAFGDDGAYVDNFYQTYYKPERMLLLEEDGVVQSMTAWFDTQLVLPGEGRRVGCWRGRTNTSAVWPSLR